MRAAFCVGMVGLLASEAASAADPDVLAACAETWPSDYVMQLDCVERQSAAKARLGALASQVGASQAGASQAGATEAGGVDGVWAGMSTADQAFMRFIKVDGDEVAHASGAAMKAGRTMPIVLGPWDGRILTDLSWTDRDKLPNQICGETPPLTLVLLLEDGGGAVDMQALFFEAALAPGSDGADLGDLGEPCDRFGLLEIEGDWGAIVNPAPDVVAVGTCTAMFGEEDSANLSRCVALEKDAILTTDAFLGVAEQKAAYQECVSMLRGSGSQDFNPRYVYLNCARSTGREEAFADCMIDHGVALVDGVMRYSGEDIFAIADTQACVIDRLGILQPWR